MTDFQKFSKLVHDRFIKLAAAGKLFVTVDDREKVWETYLASFPEGSNPIYITRTEHDCNCCRNFIKNLGNVVSIVDGKMESIWAVEGSEYPYNKVAETLDTFVTSQPITNLYVSEFGNYGNEFTRQLLPSGETKRWNHFHAIVPLVHMDSQPAKVRGDYRTSAETLKRGLTELSPQAVADVLGLIENKLLYRGDEFKTAVQKFNIMQSLYSATPDADRDIFIWQNAGDATAGFRNSMIGTLVTDLSKGEPLENAVGAYESKAAPTNYKRTTALITPAMIKAATAKITELDLDTALERRFANIGDITINNVLWADNSTKANMKGGLEGLLMAAVAPTKINSKAEDITIEDFMVNVLPKATGINLLVQHRHQPNFVSLTAAVHEDVQKLFKWDSNFAWSYNGNLTDSVKERVKKAGGSVVGDLCCRLAWECKDDLDFHMIEPDGYHIEFRNKRQLSPSGGMLDLDANGGDGMRDDPAENIYYASRSRMKEGVYKLYVNNWASRSVFAKGFVVEIEYDGVTHNICCDRRLKTGESVSVAAITYSKANGFSIKTDLPTQRASVDVWGIKTETFVKVETVMLSPNHWDGKANGNKHFMFMLEGCRNPEAARGVYNEFLIPELDIHRKVFEVLGDRMKCEVTAEQLSGLGFSSTKRDSVTVQVVGDKLQKTYSINF